MLSSQGSHGLNQIQLNFFNQTDINPSTINHSSYHKLKAIDLFAGVGGIRLGFEQVFKDKIEFVFASELDKFAGQTYHANFNDMPHGDITQIDAKDIPPHDIILAGFPCQAFSVAGLRKGFEDTRGTLFFDVVRIAKHHRPKLIFLENVKGFNTSTISARYQQDRSEILIEQANKNPRKLTPREAGRLQGFPDSFVIPVSDVQA